MANAGRNKPFSMIREFHLADWFTLANAICGTGALFSAMSYIETGGVKHIYFACALVLVALVFDILDGRIARWRQQSSIASPGARICAVGLADDQPAAHSPALRTARRPSMPAAVGLCPCAYVYAWAALPQCGISMAVRPALPASCANVWHHSIFSLNCPQPPHTETSHEHSTNQRHTAATY